MAYGDNARTIFFRFAGVECRAERYRLVSGGLTYLPTPTYPPTYQPTYPPSYLPIHLLYLRTR